MNQGSINVNGINCTVYTMNTVVVGSGAAGFNAVDRLYSFGQKDIALVTEGLNKGTSRNTGSDKQTYYRLTLAGAREDSVYSVAASLFQGGSMDGDIALVEAALSSWCFYHLVDLGVAFPHNRYGEFVGYQTDHDVKLRASSVGPLTSKMMTEKLEEQVLNKGIKIFNRYQVIAILTYEGCAVGILTLNLNQLSDIKQRYVIFNTTNIVYATGGPAGIYAASVYPTSQTGASGIALEAGAAAKNVTESQYGLASIKFRWNLSGTYQQVLPRYVSTNQEGGDEQEFLQPYFDNPGQMLNAIFLKGYQWPFDPRKIADHGSSLIDILVYNETVVKGRRVYLDYTRNPAWDSIGDGKLDFSLLGKEAAAYLKNSEACFGTPIERLQKMNAPAVKLYADHNIDLSKEYLEIAVCAQHNNGGLAGNIWWESNLRHFFPVGEVNGTHGIYRPGGTALNSGQVGSTRAAQYIAANYGAQPLTETKLAQACGTQLGEKITLGESFLENKKGGTEVWKIRQELGTRMSLCGAHIRSQKQIIKVLADTKQILENLADQTAVSVVEQLPAAFQNYDLLLTQLVYLSAILDYIKQGGSSRGSYLISDQQGSLAAEGLDERFRYKVDQRGLSDKIQVVKYDRQTGTCTFNWRQVRNMPKEENWFETVWQAYRTGGVVK